MRVLLGDESFYCRFYEVDQLLPELRPSPALYLAYRRGKVSPGQFVQRYQEEIQSDQRRAAALGKLVELVRSGQNLVILDGEIKCPVPPGEVLLQLIAQKISEPRTSLSGQDNADHRST
ncbi:MAG: hypothetical protein HY335_09005 [Deinococcus sp.]|nr:hypothetical protein [Deinococcus sp.]